MTVPFLSDAAMAGFFRWLLEASLWATAIAALIVAGQALLGRWLTPIWRYRLWGVMVVRLLLPGLAIIPATIWAAHLDRNASDTAGFTNKVAPVSSSTASAARSQPSDSHVAVVYGPVPNHAIIPAPPSSQGSLIARGDWKEFQMLLIELWVAGAGVLLVRLAAANLRLGRLLKRAKPLTNPMLCQSLNDCCNEMGVSRRPDMLLTDAIRAPAVWGVWKPRILIPADLPDGLSPNEIHVILLHELAHIRCADLAADWMLALLGILHWFNPLLRAAFKRMHADREAARDAMVLTAMSNGNAPGIADVYGRTLLKLAESLCQPTREPRRALGPGYALLPSFFGARSDLRKRLDLVHQFPGGSRRLWASGPLVALALAGCAVATACKPVASNPGPSSASPTNQPTASHAPTSPNAEASVQQMEAQIRALKNQRNYAEALALAEQVLKRDPANNYASLIRPWLRDQVAFEEGVEAGVPSDLAIQHQLDHVYPKLELSGIALSDAIDFFRSTSGASIFANWKSLESAGVRRDVPVNVKLGPVTLARALRAVLDSAAGRDGLLGFAVDEGIITVSTADDLTKNVSVRVYDVRDLIKPIPDFSVVGVGADPKVAADQTKRLAPPQTEEEMGRSLIQLIESTIDAETWKDHGGSVGATRLLQGQLIVTQTPANQRRVMDLLRELREGSQLQISVEARLLVCDQSAAEALVAKWQQAGNGASLGFVATTRPSGPVDSRVSLFLDRPQVTELLQEVAKSPGVSVISSPRITLFNGQHAYVEVGNPHKYVSGYAAVVAAGGATRYDPISSQIEDGTLLDVQATASADRKYVTLWLHTQFSKLLGMTQATWAGAPAGLKLMIQKPDIDTFEVQSTISIPDNGTLLMPVLLTPQPATRPAATQPEASPQSVLLLIRPTIIAQREVVPSSAPITSRP